MGCNQSKAVWKYIIHIDSSDSSESTLENTVYFGNRHYLGFYEPYVSLVLSMFTNTLYLNYYLQWIL